MASKQTAQNINPLSEIRPNKIVVIITNDFKEPADELMKEMQSSGFQTEPFYVQNESSLKSLNEQFAKLLEEFFEKYPDDEMIANITGGTKLMGISLYQVFDSNGFRSFYCDKDQSKMIWLDDETAVSNIGSKIGLKQYLKIHQYKITNKTTLAELPKSYKDYANILYQELCKAGKYEQTCNLIGKIHALTQDKPFDNTNFSENESLFLYHLEKETGLFSVKNGKIIPNDKEVQKLMNGGWFEIVVANALNRDIYRDIHCGIHFEKSTQRKNNSTLQELDVMAMRDDKLLIVECKAKNWQGKTAEASEAIYKLVALSGIGGLNTLPIFVSLRDVPPSAKTRAAEMGIQVIAGQSGILELKSKLNS